MLYMPLTTAVKILLQLQWGAPVRHVYVYAGATPRNAGIPMGCGIIGFLEAKMDCTASPSELHDCGQDKPGDQHMH